MRVERSSLTFREPQCEPIGGRTINETALATALNVSYMAEQLAIFAIVVGIALLLAGIGLVILAFAVFGEQGSRKEALGT